VSVKLTENQHVLLKTAARREDHCLVLPSNLKGSAAQKVAAKLIAEGLAKEIKAKAGAPIWRRDRKSDHAYSLKLSAAGAKAIAADQERIGEPAPGISALESPPYSVGSSKTSRHPAEADKAAPRAGSKLASVIALLSRSEGASVGVLTKATGWLPHTTRAAITGVRKRGYSVILDRDVEGASVYRLSDAQESNATTSAAEPQEHKPSRRRRGAKAKAAA
jgi:hypothetical protein